MPPATQQITHYATGSYWVPQATFTVNDVETDPTTLVVKIKNPAGTITTITELTPASPAAPIIRDSAGVFHHSGILLDTSGYWFVRFQGTGTAAATQDFEAIVDPSEFTSGAGITDRALVSLAETKDWLNIEQNVTKDDLDIVRLINDLSQRVIDESGREFKPIAAASSARTFRVTRAMIQTRTVPIGDANLISLVEIVDNDWATSLQTVTTSYYTTLPTVRQAWEPIRALEFHPDVTQLRYGMRVRVTATWGFPSVPGNIRQAVLDAVAAARDRHVESYSQDLSAPTGPGTTNVIVRPQQTQILSLPPRVQAVVESYRDPIVA